MDYLLRQEKLREHLSTTRFDALLITYLPNIRYLCGFTGSAGVLLVQEDGSVFITDVRYDTQGRAEVKGAKVVIAKKALFQALGDWIAARRKGKRAKTFNIGIEGDHMTVGERKRLSALLPSRAELKESAPVLERMRMVKDADELESIRAAVRLGATLFDKALETLRAGVGAGTRGGAGVRETEVAGAMEYAARLAGAEGMSFPTIIASGERSALPHGRASTQPVADGAFMVCDFGVILAGYCSDQTRTVWVNAASGKVPDEARRAYEAVKEAQLAGIRAVGPGVSTGEVDEAARSVLRRAKLGKYFTHSTGHGVGMEIHEIPRVAAGQRAILRAGMVITIEPGVYFPGKWGIRIEDMVAVNETGCEVLTPTSKDFLAV